MRQIPKERSPPNVMGTRSTDVDHRRILFKLFITSANPNPAPPRPASPGPKPLAPNWPPLEPELYGLGPSCPMKLQL